MGLLGKPTILGKPQICGSSHGAYDPRGLAMSMSLHGRSDWSLKVPGQRRWKSETLGDAKKNVPGSGCIGDENLSRSIQIYNI